MRRTSKYGLVGRVGGFPWVALNMPKVADFARVREGCGGRYVFSGPCSMNNKKQKKQKRFPKPTKEKQQLSETFVGRQPLYPLQPQRKTKLDQIFRQDLSSLPKNPSF
jgi:hypothetical protein